MLEIIQDTLLDGIKLVPFLFITYLLMEFLEHKTTSKVNATIKKSGRYGPLIGGILGLLPQCGFSVMATNLYMARIITLGTLISIYLTTSDEMLPILISEEVQITVILKILAIKLLIGVLAGIIIDIVFSKANKKHSQEEKVDFCEHEHCHCEDGIFKSAIRHTASIFIFILIITFILNLIIHFIGEDTLSNLVLNNNVLGPVLAGLIGLIPNCAASVIITKLYIENVITASIMVSGLLVNAGVGLLVLFRVNRSLKENIKITTLLYSIGVISGIILQLVGFTI